MIKFLFSLFLTAITVTNTYCIEKFHFSLDFSCRPKISLSFQKLPRRTSKGRTQRFYGVDQDSAAIYGRVIDHPRRKRELERATSPESDYEQDTREYGIPAEYNHSNPSPSPPRSPPANTNRPTTLMSRNSDSENRDYGRRDGRHPSRERDRDRHRYSRSPGRNDRRRRRNDRQDDPVKLIFSHLIEVSFYF